MTTETGGHLAGLFARGAFTVTGEIVPPRRRVAAPIREHAVALVGSVDAVNLTDNPTASAHMSPLAGVAAASAAGHRAHGAADRPRPEPAGAHEPTCSAAWALGARNVFCLSGDPLHVGDHPDAVVVGDLAVNDVVALAKRMRDDGTRSPAPSSTDLPRYLIGVADVPLADPYDPAKLGSEARRGRRLRDHADRLRRPCAGRLGGSHARARALRAREGRDRA